MLYALMHLLGLVSLVSAAAFHPARQVQSLQPNLAQQACPLATVYSYITVTVTNIPDVVTVAVPDYSSISKSLANAETINSIYVVDQSQDRPFLAPPDTVVPTFIESIYAPAVEITEAPHLGSSVVFLPGTRPPSTIVISVTTESIIIPPLGGWTATPTPNLQSTARDASSLDKTFTVPPNGWNGTQPNATDIAPISGTGTDASQGLVTTVTATTYVNTTTYVANATVTTTTPSGSPSSYSGYGGYVKRQTCVLISAEISGHWASWCNNWDGSTTYTYTTWGTTVTPGVAQASSSPANPTSSTTNTSTQASTTTVAVTGSPTTMTETVVQVSTTSNSQPVSSSASVPDPAPSSCGETGTFNIGFDDLPTQSIFANATAALPPIFNPFEHFYWADGWSYLPPPNDPYPPHNGGQLAIYVPSNEDTFVPTDDARSVPPGGFSAGPRSSVDAYWFNIQSAWFGCENNDTDPADDCDFVAEAYRYDNATDTNRIHTTVHFSQKLCHSSACQLQPIYFTDVFTQLSGISFYAKIGSGIRTFYMDDLQLSWWNDTCEAGQLRASSRKR